MKAADFGDVKKLLDKIEGLKDKLVSIGITKELDVDWTADVKGAVGQRHFRLTVDAEHKMFQLLLLQVKWDIERDIAETMNRLRELWVDR